MTGKCHAHNKNDKPFRPGKKQPFWMPDTEDVIAELGNEPPLIADGRSGPPDRREVSARWLSGTFLTGVTSSVLMGVALFAALDGRQQLATPPEIAELAQLGNGGDSGEIAKTTRLVALRQIAKAKDRRRMEVSMVTKVGDRDVIHTSLSCRSRWRLPPATPPTAPIRLSTRCRCSATTATTMPASRRPPPPPARSMVPRSKAR
ncbi:hypothetical protein AJ88_43825 [Mesorhizobium amorphae CCBAU 01583]|nr:hypothetical protein AJ88_43825 [Mesorhizobium amorphae CCBAU 01583]